MQHSSLAKHISEWLNEKLRLSGRKGFIVGVSGGVDSALVSTLCAMTKRPLMAITLPIHQAADQIKRGDNHIEWLCNSFNTEKHLVIKETVDLTIPFETFRTTLHKKVAEDPLAMANLRSRLRMCTLYSYAGHYEYLASGFLLNMGMEE
jgi:NAD+ synthase